MAGRIARLTLTRSTLVALSLALSTAVPPASARNEHRGRAQLETLAHGLETLAARFEQRVISADGTVEDRTEGRVWLRHPHFFRWEYGGEFPEVIVADGARVWIHDVALEQVTVKPQSEMAADSPLTLLTDIDRLDEQFEVREAGDYEGMDVLELRPVQAEAEFERVLLGLRGDMLQMMTMEDAFGLRTEIRFFDVERNATLDEALFVFTPPPEADVIGDTAGETGGR